MSSRASRVRTLSCGLACALTLGACGGGEEPADVNVAPPDGAAAGAATPDPASDAVSVAPGGTPGNGEEVTPGPSVTRKTYVKATNLTCKTYDKRLRGYAKVETRATAVLRDSSPSVSKHQTATEFFESYIDDLDEFVISLRELAPPPPKLRDDHEAFVRAYEAALDEVRAGAAAVDEEEPGAARTAQDRRKRALSTADRLAKRLKLSDCVDV
ncbi:MAG: hypothetical protein ACR2NA_00705 [Solirubrobacterales bacterium]